MVPADTFDEVMRQLKAYRAQASTGTGTGTKAP
jgi:hypothetical protein